MWQLDEESCGQNQTQIVVCPINIFFHDVQNGISKILESYPLFGLKFVLRLHLLRCGIIDHEEDTAAKA